MDTEKKTSQLEEMRAKRSSAESIFMKFISYKDSFNTHAFCFFEGEDAKYYNLRIQKYWGENYISFIPGSKKEVIKVMNKIQSCPLYANVTTMYFIDHDFDEHYSPANSDLFETPCHSIENFYAQETVLHRILKAEFNINPGDKDFQKCITTFQNRFNEFNSIMLVFNALLQYQRKFAPSAQSNFNSVKTSELVSCSIDHIEKATKCDQIEDELRSNINPDAEILSSIMQGFRTNPENYLLFRGKNQLDFFVAILQEFKNLSSSREFFSCKIPRVYLNITKNRLSELSQYAITPPELEEFLSSHVKQSVSA